VPVDLGSTAVSGIHRQANEALKALLGIQAQEPVHDLIQGLVVPDERILQRFGVDFRRVALRPSSAAAAAWPSDQDDTYVDEWGLRRQRTELYWEIVESPLADAKIEDLRHYPWPDPRDPARVAGLAEEARRLYEETDYALVADFLGGGIFEQALWMRGFERFMVDLVSNQPFVTALLDILLELYIEFYDVYLEAVGPYVQIRPGHADGAPHLAGALPPADQAPTQGAVRLHSFAHRGEDHAPHLWQRLPFGAGPD